MDKEVGLRELIEILWAGKWVLASVTIIVLLLSGIATSLTLAPVYESSAAVSIVVSTPLSFQPDLQAAREFGGEDSKSTWMVEMFRKRLTDPSFVAAVEAVLESKGVKLEAPLAGAVRLALNTETDVVTITARAGTPQGAREMADVIAGQFQQFVHQANRDALKANLEQMDRQLELEENYLARSIQAVQARLNDTSLTVDAGGSVINPAYSARMETLAQLEAHLAQVEAKRSEVRVLLSDSRLVEVAHLGGTVADIASPAHLPPEPVGPGRFLILALSGVLGLITSTFLVFFLYFWQKTASSETARNRCAG